MRAGICVEVRSIDHTPLQHTDCDMCIHMRVCIYVQGDKLTMHYRGTLTNGKQFDASYDRGQPFQFQIGVGQVSSRI